MSAAKKLSEYFSINIRNERFSIQSLRKVTFRLNDSEILVRDISESGISIEVDEEIAPLAVQKIEVMYSGKKLFELSAEIVRSTRSQNKYLIAMHFIDSHLPENFLNNLKLCGSTDVELSSLILEAESLNRDFLLNCSLLKNFLVNLKIKCDEYENINYINSLDTKVTSIDLAISIFGSTAIDNIKKYAHALDKAYQSIGSQELRLAHANYFRAHLGEYFVEASFTGRAFYKPRGYAGDYEMMNQIYRNSPEGGSLFEKVIHLYGINEASSVSVRLRKEYLKEKIKKLLDGKSSEIIIGSLACGPAREVIEIIDSVDSNKLEKVRFVLMDQDHHALLNARRNIMNIVRHKKYKCEVNFLPLSVKQILEASEESEVLNAIKFDLLYTAGLYDYLPQAIAKSLTTIISKSVKEGGELIIGNFHPDNPTKTISDLVADWRLIHRNKEQMRDLILDSNFKEISFYLDKIGIDLFLEAKK